VGGAGANVHHTGQVRSQVHPWPGVPNRIITDNGSQFTSGLFREYCTSAGIKICFASVAYPRSNGQVERANAEALKGLKMRSFNPKL
jgi:transposase InsO family protein